MIITYVGHSCFKIQSKSGADGITLTTDPFDKSVGFKVPNFESDIVTVSHNHHDHNNVAALRGNPFVVDTAGEYDVKGVLIQGVDSFHDGKKGEDRGVNVMYRIEMDDISVAHLGDLGTTLDDKQLEVLSGVDILMIPVGGNFTIDAKKAVEVISQIEPRVIIPMHYKVGPSTVEVDSLDKFIREMGLKPIEEIKYKISKKDLPQEDVQLIVLSVQG